MARSRFALAAAVAGATVAADQLTKALVRAGEDRLPLLVADEFGLSVTYNSGISFGRFQGGGAVIIAVVTLLVVVLMVLVARLPRRYTVPLALIVGGALGNLIDRVRWGSVLDFVAAGPWPTFNVADVAIVAGAVLVAWRTLRAPAKPSRPAAPPTNPPPSGRQTDA